MTRSTHSANDENTKPATLTCEQCNIKFSTRKTYLSHIKYKHADSRLVYPCPECSETYASLWSVYRHLFNVHRKTVPQVRKLREQIQSKAFHEDQSTLKKSADSSKTNLNEDDKMDDINLAWMENFEADNDMQMCGGCGRRFERRAALNSHSQTCQKRIAARNMIVTNKSKRSAVVDDRVDKKPMKIAKLDSIPELKGSERRKPAILKKRKIGIQIRYDYTKPSDKNIASPLPVATNIQEESNEIKSNTEALGECKGIKTSPNVQKQVKQTQDMEDANSTIASKNDENLEVLKAACPVERLSNTDNLFSITGAQSVTKDNSPEQSMNSASFPDDMVIDPDIVSIPSSNSSPSKEEDPLSMKDLHTDTDSEIEEIFGTSSDSCINNIHRTSDVNINNPDYQKSQVEKLMCEQNETNNVNADTIKLLNLIDKESSASENKISLDDKMEKFVNIRKLQCNPCDTKFGNLSKLRSHMSLHFNWMRFCCDICSFKTYEKMSMYDHIKDDHNVLELEKIEAVIFQIPDWEIIEMSSKQFIEIDHVLDCSTSSSDMSVLMIDNEDDNKSSTSPDSLLEQFDKKSSQMSASKVRGRPRKKKGTKTSKVKKNIENVINEDISLIEDKPSRNASKQTNKRIVPNQPAEVSVASVEGGATEMRDVALRKMVLEVIFGQNVEPTYNQEKSSCDNADRTKDVNVSIESAEVTNVISRPVRNRVKPIDKDFIYDLNDLRELPRTASQNSSRSYIPFNKHVTGSLEVHSVNNSKSVVQNFGKRPGPKCKTMFSCDVSGNDRKDNSVKTLPLQKNDKKIKDLGIFGGLSDSQTTDSSDLFSASSASNVDASQTNIENTYSDGEDSDIYIIEDDEDIHII